MSEEQSFSDSEQPKHELEHIWERDIPNIREGIKVSWISISSSEKKPYLEGFSGLKVEHVPLAPNEQAIFGLPQLEKPYLATYIFLDPNSIRDNDKEQWSALLSNYDAGSKQAKDAQLLFSAWKDALLPMRNQLHPEFITVEDTDKKTKATALKLPQDILAESIAAHPEKEICFLVQHGTTDSLKPGDIQKDRIVGSPNEGTGSGDYTYHLINAIEPQQFAAVIDTGCSAIDYLPSASILPTETPYIASQTVTFQKSSRGSQLNSSSSVVLLNGQTLRYDWSEQNKHLREASLAKAKENTVSVSSFGKPRTQ